MMEFKNLKMTWLGHAGFIIEGSRKIAFDPFKVKNAEKVEFLFITHDHFDHCSLEDIEKVTNENTVVFCAAECVGKIAKLKVNDIIPMQPNERKEHEDITIETIPAYNTNKQFHPRADNKLGFIVTLDSKRIYHAGDTDATDELKSLKNIDIALVPVSGKYVMTAKEAAEAINIMKPKLAIPMHYGEIVGDKNDAEKFKALTDVNVEIL